MSRYKKNPFGDLVHFNPFNNPRRLRPRRPEQKPAKARTRARPGMLASQAVRSASCATSSRILVEPCKSRPKHSFESHCFDSIKEARAFLEFKVPEMSDAECDRNAERIAYAEKVVARADKRNEKRKVKRKGLPVSSARVTPQAGRGLAPTQIPTQAPVKKLVPFYEEVLGPEGEIIRFKLTGQDGKFEKRTRTKEEPPIGSIILDLTCGVKAWKRHSDKRRSVPLTAEMRKSYERSFLFKVRQLAAGKISPGSFAREVSPSYVPASIETLTSGAVRTPHRGDRGPVTHSRKLRRKNRKNRK